MTYRNIFLLSLSLLMLLGIAYSATGQRPSLQSYVGLEYQMSYNNHWGANCPIVLTVYPNSPAAQAGLKAGDIIEVINGAETSTMDESLFVEQLQGFNHKPVKLQVTNFQIKRAERTLEPIISPVESLSERLLARAFSMYSLEDESDILVTYPISTGIEGKRDLTAIKSFAFVASSGSYTVEDQHIDQCIRETLRAKGVSYDPQKPDILVDTYYSIIEHPAYNAKKANEENIPAISYRIDPVKHRLEPLPVLRETDPDYLAKYLLKFGIVVYSADTNEILWTAEAQERLSDDLSIDRYASMTAPIMLLQFPFTRYYDRLVVRFATHQHLEMGVDYQAEEVSMLRSVGANSPAERAGLRAGDRIIMINNRPIKDSAKDLTKTYMKFVEKSMAHREKYPMFVIKDGPKNCRYWSTNRYNRIVKLLDNKQYQTGFSYLFAFSPWISTHPSQILDVDYIRDGVLQRTRVEAHRVESNYISVE